MIFITENDAIGGGLPIYTIDRQITNMDQPFDDGEHIIYVNGADKDASTALGMLTHDFFCTDTDDMHYKGLLIRFGIIRKMGKVAACQWHAFSNDRSKTEKEAMCKVMEDMRKEEAKKTTVEHIRNIMDKLKYSVEQAMDLLSIPQADRATYVGLVQKK